MKLSRYNQLRNYFLSEQRVKPVAYFYELFTICLIAVVDIGLPINDQCVANPLYA